MNVFFDPVRYNHYYNCSMYNLSDVPIESRRKPLAAACFFILGAVLTSVYLPCLYAMTQAKMLAHPCYKLMFFIGIVNLTELLSLAIQGGIFALEGAVFCTHPTVSYLSGVLVTSLYYTETNTGCILALNRLLTLYQQKWANTLFKGQRTFIWLLMPIVLPLCIAFTSPPYIYNSVLNSWTQNPHFGYYILPMDLEEYYFQALHQYYSCAVIFSLLIIYGIFLVTFIIKRKQSSSTSSLQINERDRSIFIQVFWISLLCSFVGICYTFEKQISQIAILVPFYTYGFIIYQGSPAIIYLLLNRTIRSQLFCRHPSTLTIKPAPYYMNNVNVAQMAGMRKASAPRRS